MTRVKEFICLARTNLDDRGDRVRARTGEETQNDASTRGFASSCENQSILEATNILTFMMKGQLMAALLRMTLNTPDAYVRASRDDPVGFLPRNAATRRERVALLTMTDLSNPTRRNTLLRMYILSHSRRAGPLPDRRYNPRATARRACPSSEPHYRSFMKGKKGMIPLFNPAASSHAYVFEDDCRSRIHPRTLEPDDSLLHRCRYAKNNASLFASKFVNLSESRGIYTIKMLRNDARFTFLGRNKLYYELY